jgi:hypothetical protein
MMKPDIHRNGKTMLTTMNHNIHCDETAILVGKTS